MIACPGCGAGLRFDIKSQMMTCDHCDGQYDPQLFADKQKDAEPVSEGKKARNEKTVHEPLDMEMAAYRCPQCGAELYTTDETDITAVCSYCGGANIIFDRMCRIKRPRYIIPFQLTKEDCIRQYRKAAARSLFTPRFMRKKTAAESFRGIYMPYWSFDLHQNGHTAVEGIGFPYTEGNYTCKDHFNYNGKIDMTYRGIAHDASRAFDDGISECLAPFDAEGRVAFSPAYLSGFYADAADVEPKDLELNAIETARLHTAENIIREQAKELLSKNECQALARGSIANAEIPCEVTETAEVFYPVWFMSVRKRDKIFYAAVNGQTGKVAADLPISPLRFTLFALLLAVLAYAVLELFLVLKPGGALGVTLLLMLIGLFINDNMYNNLLRKMAGQDTGILGKEIPADEGFGSCLKAFVKNILRRLIGYSLLIGFMVYAYVFFSPFVIPILFLIWIIQHIKYGKRNRKKTAKKQNPPKTLGELFKTYYGGIFQVVKRGFGISSEDSAPKQKTAGHRLYHFFKILGIFEILAGLIIIIANPVRNVVFYNYCFFVVATFLLMVFDLFRVQAKLASRRPPQFNKTGGDNNA